MDKRYQVFVSSTYTDLKDARAKVFQTLMEMDCFPSGMELFPAADEEQFEFIKKVIDDCDYYLVIIGGRYGSITAEGVSYTEKEYEYAIEKGLKVIAFIHENPGKIEADSTELDPELRERLDAFREKLKDGRLVKHWNSADQLAGLVSLSLNKTIKTHPAVGWVRANQIGSGQLLNEVNELRKQNESFRTQLESLRAAETPNVEDLAGLDETISLSGKYYIGSVAYSFTVAMSWNEIFAAISPYLLRHPPEEYVKKILAQTTAAKEKPTSKGGGRHTLEEQDFMTVRIQLLAYKLIAVSYKGSTRGTMALFWTLTPKGHSLMMDRRTVRTEKRD